MSFALSSLRSDVFPVGTTVKVFAAPGRVTTEGRPPGAEVTSAAVDVNGKFEVEVAETGRYVLAAEVSGTWRQVIADNRSFSGRPPLAERVLSRRIANGVIYG